MPSFISTKLLLAFSMIAVLVAFGLQASSSQVNTTMNNTTQLIIKFNSKVAVADMANQVTTILGEAVTYERAMAVADHHVFKLAKKLTAKELTDAIKALTNDPNIELVEENIMMQHMMPNNFNQGGSLQMSNQDFELFTTQQSVANTTASDH